MFCFHGVFLVFLTFDLPASVIGFRIPVTGTRDGPSDEILLLFENSVYSSVRSAWFLQSPASNLLRSTLLVDHLRQVQVLSELVSEPSLVDVKDVPNSSGLRWSDHVGAVKPFMAPKLRNDPRC